MGAFRDTMRRPIGDLPAVVPVQETMLSQRGGAGPSTDAFLLEDLVSFLLLENGDNLLLE